MPCLTKTNLSAQEKAAQVTALQRLQAALGAGTVRVIVGRTGGIAFQGWTEDQRSGVSDICAYRALANSPELRRAVTRAQAISGNLVSSHAIGHGAHSHDGGKTWGTH